jgi:hypothetical protein
MLRVNSVVFGNLMLGKSWVLPLGLVVSLFKFLMYSKYPMEGDLME